MGRVKKHPATDRIEIDEVKLLWEMHELGDGIDKRISVFDFLLVGPLWLPVFVSEFKDFAGISGATSWGVYTGVIGIMTLLWIFRGKDSVLYWIFKASLFLPWRWGRDFCEDWLRNHEADPKKRVQNILEECKRRKPPATESNAEQKK